MVNSDYFAAVGPSSFIRASTPDDFAQLVDFFEEHPSPFKLVGSKKSSELILSGTNVPDRAAQWQAWLQENLNH